MNGRRTRGNPFIDSLAASDIHAMSQASQRAGGIDLAQGNARFPLAPELSRAVAQAMAESRVSYSPSAGVPVLREAISRKTARFRGMAFDPETEIAVTTGVATGFSAACLALFEPGAEIVVFEPFYPYHHHIAAAFGLRPVVARLSEPGWTLDMERLERAIGPRTRGVVVCTPSNPGGKVWSAEELDALLQVCERHDLLVVTDEIYEHLVYDGRAHVPPSSRPGARARTVSLSGFSKTYGVTGWRVGYALGEAALVQRLAAAHTLLCACAPTPLQHALVAALELPDAFYVDLNRSFERRRDLLCSALSAAGLPPRASQGGYFVLADLERLGGPGGRDATMRLLERTGVAAVPASAFFENGAEGKHLARFCFGVEDDLLEDATRRLRRL